MRITEFQLDRYGPLHHPRTECDGGLEVYYGPNESGKTLLLEGLLRILEPDIPSVMDGVDRVSDPPAGYLVLEADGETYQLGDDQVLTDIAPITPNHLRNIFVVRDSDLGIRQHHEFYDTVTEQIGDLHTSEIEAIQDRLEDLGRLTSRRRNVSSAAEYSHAADVRDSARQLAEDVRGYISEASAAGLDELEAKLVELRARLRRYRAGLEDLQQAQQVAEHDRLSDQLSKVEELEAELEAVADFGRDTLERLNNIETTISNNEGEIEKLENEIDDLEGDIERLDAEVTTLESEVRPMEERESAVDTLESDMEEFRDERSDTTGAERRMRVTRAVALTGLVLGGVATLYGVVQGQPQLLLPLLLLVIGIGGGVTWYLDHRRLSSVEQTRTALLESARDAGLTVDKVTDIAPVVTEFRSELDGKRDQIDDLDSEIQVKDGLISEHSETIDSRRDEIEGLREEKTDLLDDVGVSSIEGYREQVEKREAINDELGPARQSLIDAFGEPDGDVDLIDYWESEVAELVSDVTLEEVDPDEYDEDRHDELEDSVAEYEEQIAEIRGGLEDHRHRLDQFSDRVGDLEANPFIDEQIRLEARSIDGLRQLAEELESLADRIDRDAEISRTALDIFDELHRAEEDKITDLFEPGGRASEVFGRITDERYQRVEYDPDDRVLKVHRDNGNHHTAEELSQGTRDQLYLATRISLAEQLLDAEPGFFLMDDAFLPADSDRLVAGFQVLEELVEEGWQVLYLTAKEEVGVDIVDQMGLHCTELEPLP